MSIRMLARELYALYRQVEDLEKRIAASGQAEKDFLVDQLRKIRAEKLLLQRAMEGRKDMRR